MKESLTIIKQEHRNLFRVVNVLDQLLRRQKPGEQPDFGFMEAVLDYIENFTDQYHHPKEDRFLFKALRRRDPKAEAIIEELEAEHRDCPVGLSRLKTLLAEYRSDPSKREAFQNATRDYLKFQTKHLQKEEGVVFPMAQKVLTEDDWAEIDAAFQDNEDPIFGPRGREEARSMYSRIVNEAPAPFGFGD